MKKDFVRFLSAPSRLFAVFFVFLAEISLFAAGSLPKKTICSDLPSFGKYLTDKELEAMPFPKVRIKDYDFYEHEYPFNGHSVTQDVREMFKPKNKYLQLIDGDDGRQWLHFALGEKSEKSFKNFIRLKKTFKLGESSSYSFRFKGYQTPLNRSMVIYRLNLKIPGYSSINLFDIDIKDGDLILEVRESYKSNPEEKVKRLSLPLGSYEYGTEVNFKIENHGRTFDFYYNGEKAASVRAEGDYEDSYICSHKIGISSPSDAKNFFSDCYFYDPEME